MLQIFNNNKPDLQWAKSIEDEVLILLDGATKQKLLGLITSCIEKPLDTRLADDTDQGWRHYNDNDMIMIKIKNYQSINSCNNNDNELLY